MSRVASTRGRTPCVPGGSERKPCALAEVCGASDAEDLTPERHHVPLLKAWMTAVDGLGSASVLDPKTKHLAYLAVLAALRLESDVPFHTGLAKQAGASRDEVASAVLIGLPAAGNAVTQVLPAALVAYDAA